MKTKFKLDENLPVEVAEFLQNSGFNTRTVFDEKLTGATDSQIAKVCQDENRVLITFDIDFADIALYPPKMYPGIVVLRLKRQDKRQVLSVFSRLIKFFAKENLEFKLWVVDEERIRVRE